MAHPRPRRFVGHESIRGARRRAGAGSRQRALEHVPVRLNRCFPPSCPALCRASTSFWPKIKTWMAGTSPAMTLYVVPTLCRRSSGAMPSARGLAEAARQQSAEPVTERPRIRGPVPVEHARFVEQQVRGILLEGQIVVAERCERQDDRVARVDFQDRLGGALDAAAAGEDLLQLAIEAGFGSDQTDCALG